MMRVALFTVGIILAASSHTAAQVEAPTVAQHIYAAQARVVEGFIRDYSGQSSLNPLGKPYRTWDTADLGILPTGTLGSLRSIAIYENYDLLDQILPANMSRAEFSRGVLREMARRGEVMYYYEQRMNFDHGGDVTVSRPLGVPADQQRTVTVDPAMITARDAAIAILQNPRTGAIVVQSDVQAQALPSAGTTAIGFGIQTDTSVYDLGYSMGSIPENRSDGVTPLILSFVRSQEQLQPAYCAATNDIYNSRGRKIDQQEAFSAGFMQARMDTPVDFTPARNEIGFNANICPANTPPVTNDVRQAFALSGYTDGTFR